MLKMLFFSHRSRVACTKASTLLPLVAASAKLDRGLLGSHCQGANPYKFTRGSGNGDQRGWSKTVTGVQVHSNDFGRLFVLPQTLKYKCNVQPIPAADQLGHGTCVSWVFFGTCVSLFYVIGTGSTGFRGHTWGLPVYPSPYL